MDRQNISWRHHYVPQFYIRNFSDDGKLYGYNKFKKLFFEPRPKDIFFERNKNTFLNEIGEESDLIEKIYASIDSITSCAVNNVLRTGKLTTESLRGLLLLAYTNKWRSPSYDESFETAKKLSFEDLRLHLANIELNLEFDLEKIWFSDEMQATKRILLSFQPFLYKTDYKDIFKNSFLVTSPEPYSAILGSCPFIENPEQSDNVFESFVMPISRELTLIYDRNGKDNFVDFWSENYELYMPRFSNVRDLASFHITDSYVISSSRERINCIQKLYDEFVKKGNDIRTIPSCLFFMMKNKNKFVELLKNGS